MVLQLKNYKVRYSKNEVFNYPDIEVCEGNCICLMGSSGCGKTTLLNSLFSVDFSGKAEYNVATLFDKDINLWEKDKYKSLSYMPQYAQNGLNPLMTIESQLKLVIENNKNSIEEERINRYLGELKLDKKIMKLYPQELSGGMKQRVAMLLGFVKKPRLFVLDEPSSALDYITLFNIVTFLKKRKEEKTSLFIVSHDEAFVKSLADRVYVL